MNYQSITDKPPIPTRAGKAIWLCSDCLETKYTNEPPSMGKATCKCSRCSETATCRQYEISRLVRVPVKTRAKPAPSKREQFNIFPRKVK